MAEQDTIEKQKTWERLEKSIGKKLESVGNRRNWKKTLDGKVSFYLSYSKFYQASSRYWYGIKEKDFSFWKEFEHSFVVFILENSNEIIPVPASELQDGLVRSYIQPTDGERYKIHILKEKGKFRFLEIQDIDINPYYNYFNQVNISSASDYDDSEYKTQELQEEYKIPRKKVYGVGGESKEHKRFKEFIAANPHIIEVNGSEFIAETEFILPSADTVDILFSSKSNVIGVEVKSKISRIDDITRGLFQCVKYEALLRAFYLAEKKDIKSRTLLVLENPFPKPLIELKNILGIEVIDNIRLQEELKE